jgi:hypothetical protein
VKRCLRVALILDGNNISSRRVSMCTGGCGESPRIGGQAAFGPCSGRSKVFNLPNCLASVEPASAVVGANPRLVAWRRTSTESGAFLDSGIACWPRCARSNTNPRYSGQVPTSSRSDVRDPRFRQLDNISIGLGWRSFPDAGLRSDRDQRQAPISVLNQCPGRRAIVTQPEVFHPLWRFPLWNICSCVNNSGTCDGNRLYQKKFSLA